MYGSQRVASVSCLRAAAEFTKLLAPFQMQREMFKTRQPIGSLVLLAVVLLHVACAAAHNGAHNAQSQQAQPPSTAATQAHEGHSLSVDSIPLELFTKPLVLREGVGAVSDTVTTASQEAQAFYNQGVGYLHSYVWVEAVRSFHQALRLDDKLALAHAGIYRAYTGLGLTAAARQALDLALQLQSRASPRERRRLQAYARQQEALADINNQAKHQEYKKALDEALAADNHDVELWLLRGNAEEGVPAAGRGQRGTESSLPYYRRALELAPDHPAAHHYLTHSYENLGKIQEALRHGEMCARLAPNVPHMRHMYGHDLRRVGRIKEAIAEFNRADELQRAYFASEAVAPEYDWHHQHNLDLLSTCYQHQGQMRRAEELMRQAFNLPALLEAEAYNKREYPAFLLSRGRADEALAAAEVLKKTKWETVRVVGHILAAQVMMSRNQMPQASNEAKAALQALQASATKFQLPYIDLAILQGEFFLRTNQAEKGRQLLKQTVTRLRAEQGPDNWTQALFKLEALGRLARELNDWELADYVAAQMLDHDANYGGTHYALALVAQARGERQKAIAAFTQAAKLWGDADKELPELAQIQAQLAALMTGSRE